MMIIFTLVLCVARRTYNCHHNKIKHTSHQVPTAHKYTQYKYKQKAFFIIYTEIHTYIHTHTTIISKNNFSITLIKKVIKKIHQQQYR